MESVRLNLPNGLVCYVKEKDVSTITQLVAQYGNKFPIQLAKPFFHRDEKFGPALLRPICNESEQHIAQGHRLPSGAMSIEYYWEGSLHRINGPAVTTNVPGQDSFFMQDGKPSELYHCSDYSEELEEDVPDSDRQSG